MASFLTDSGGQVWQIGVTDTGAYTATPVFGPTGPTFIALFDQVSSNVWALSVDTNGNFLLNSLSPSTPAQNFIQAISPLGVSYEIFVKNETLYTITGFLPSSPTKCLPLLIAPNGGVWQLGITDTGLLTTNQVFVNFKYLQGPILI